jgi:hypothetical protein
MALLIKALKLVTLCMVLVAVLLSAKSLYYKLNYLPETAEILKEHKGYKVVATSGSASGLGTLTDVKEFVASQDLYFIYDNEYFFVENSEAGFAGLEAVPILFNPDNPRDYVINSPRVLWTWPILLLGLAYVMWKLIRRLEASLGLE